MRVQYEKTFLNSVNRKVWFVAFTLPFIIVTLLMFSLIGVVIVSGDSMSPTYNNGDLLLTVQTGYIPDYNDILICNGSNYPIIKRVIGKPGDIIDTENNLITVNGFKTDISAKERTIRLPHTVEPNSYFLVGDNTAVSHDSRYEAVGDIHESQIIGKVIFKVEGKMNKNYEFTIDDKAMLEEIESKEPSNAFDFLKATKNIDIEYKTNKFKD